MTLDELRSILQDAALEDPGPNRWDQLARIDPDQALTLLETIDTTPNPNPEPLGWLVKQPPTRWGTINIPEGWTDRFFTNSAKAKTHAQRLWGPNYDGHQIIPVIEHPLH